MQHALKMRGSQQLLRTTRWTSALDRTCLVFSGSRSSSGLHQRRSLRACALVTEDVQAMLQVEQGSVQMEQDNAAAEMAERKQRRQREQLTYQISAIAASAGVIALAVGATYFRFHWHLNGGQEVPWTEMLATLSLVAGGVFGMEMWARYAHKSLWHEYEPGWALHKSHHEPRTGPFEDNDVFAVVNGVPAMLLCAYGFLTPGIPGGLCFGAGLGITLFGIMYMYVHDGLVHRRFPVGPIAQLPYMKTIAVAHQLHHSEKYGGAPWGMFLAVQELEAIPGAKEDLERLVAELDWSKR